MRTRRNVYLISYPRSGNSLTRAYFSCLTGRPQLSVYEGDEVLPENRPLTAALDGVELIKSHQFDARYSEFVYIVRDGRNAMISHLYLQFLHGGHRFTRHEEINDGMRFLSGQGHFWGDHVKEALNRALTNRVCFVKYEDLARDPLRVLRIIIRFLGTKVGDATLAECIRRVDRSTTYVNNYFNGYTYVPEEGSIYYLLKKYRHEDYWKHIFDRQTRQYFHEQGGTELLLKFGYERSADWWKHDPS